MSFVDPGRRCRLNCRTRNFRAAFIYIVVQKLVVINIFKVSLSSVVGSSPIDAPFWLLAKVIQQELAENTIGNKLGDAFETGIADECVPSILELTKTISNLASNQQAFKVSL